MFINVNLGMQDRTGRFLGIGRENFSILSMRFFKSPLFFACSLSFLGSIKSVFTVPIKEIRSCLLDDFGKYLKLSSAQLCVIKVVSYILERLLQPIPPLPKMSNFKWLPCLLSKNCPIMNAFQGFKRNKKTCVSSTWKKFPLPHTPITWLTR